MDEFNLDTLRMGYIIVYKSKGGFFSRQIEKLQLSRGFPPHQACFTHVEVSGGGPYSVNVAPPKTRVVDIRKVHAGRYIKVMRYVDPDYEARTRYKVAFWAASNCNLPYDWFGCLKFKLKFLWHFKSRFFCSENTGFALRKEHEFIFPVSLPNHKLLPAHFLWGVRFEQVWEGIISSKA